MSQQVERGDGVVCTLTGFGGIATSEIFGLTGQKRFNVQPRVNEKGEVPDSYAIDESSLKIVIKNQVPALPMADDRGINLRDVVEEEITHIKGHVIEKSINLNGCVRVAVQPPLNKDNEIPKTQAFDVARLKKIEAAKTQSETPELRKTGGPMERIVRD